MTMIPVYPPGYAPEGPLETPGDDHGLLVGIFGGINRIARHHDQASRVRAEEASHVWSVTIDPVPIPLGPPVFAAGFGVLDIPNLFSPQLGEHWDVHTISVTGFTAGSVSAWVNLPAGAQTATPNGALRASFPSAGFANFGKNQCHLRPQDRLVFIAQGITLGAGQPAVLVSMEATRVADQYWGRYLI